MHAFGRGVTACTLLLLALTLSGSASEARRPGPTGALAGPSALPSAAAIRGQLAKLPLAFVPNLGQASADVRYVSLGPSPRLELTDTEVRLTGPAARRGSNVVSLRLAGGARPSRVESQDELPGKVHHFDSNDPQQWRRDIPTFRRVAYRDVYPATDLVFHGSQGAAEFDFVLRPGASPRAIGIDVRGADAVALDGEDVVIRTGGDTLRMHAPVVYQDSATGRKLVDGRFSIQDSRIGFEIGAYDRAKPLVIDPVVTYSTYLGGTGREEGAGVGVDAAGNIYIANGFPGVTADQVVKLSADGQTLLYSVTLGDMQPHGLVADAAGNAYIVSTCPYSFSGGGPPVCPTRKSLASGRPTSQGDFATYVTKLDPTGAILFSTSMGGLGSVLPGGIAIDEAGNMYVTAFGPFGGFPLTRPPFVGIPGGGPFHAVVEAIAADYSRFLYVVEFFAFFEPRALAVDRAGAVYVTGIAHEGNFPTTPGVIQPTAPLSQLSTGAVAKIAPDSSLAYATFFGNASTAPTAIAVDAIGHAYLTGSAGPGLPTVNARQPDLAGGASDAFVARLNATASALVFSTYLGGGGDDAAMAIALDSSTNIYLAGPTTSVDFPQQSALPPELGQAGSNFVVEMTPDGRSLVYSTYFADAQTTVTALHATATGTVYLTGTTTSAAFPTVRPFQAMYGGSGDAFVATLVPSEPRVFVDEPGRGSHGERHRVDRRVGGKLRRHFERLHADRREHRRRPGHRQQSRDPGLGQPLDPARRDHAHGDGARRGRAHRGHHARSHRPQRPPARGVHHEPAGRRGGGGSRVVGHLGRGGGGGAPDIHAVDRWHHARHDKCQRQPRHAPLGFISRGRWPAGDRRDGARRGWSLRDRHPQSHRPQRPGARGVHHEPAGRRDRGGSGVVGHLGRGGGSSGDPDLHAVDRRHHARHGDRRQRPRDASLGLIAPGRRPPDDRRHGPRRRRSHRGRHTLRQHPERSSGGGRSRATVGDRAHAVRPAAGARCRDRWR